MRTGIFLIVFLSCFLYAGAQSDRSNQIRFADSCLLKTGEVYFSFSRGIIILAEITGKISIAKVKNDTVWAFANKNEFDQFLQLNIPFHVIINFCSRPDLLKSSTPFGTYPSYSAYVNMMNQFAADYPKICKLVNIGTSAQGRQILFVEISKHPGIKKTEPGFLYTSTMHGNEPVGYVLMLRLINYLLTNYGDNARITRLIDSMDIWINPLANPDGTYFGGDSDIEAGGSIRYNANQVDLNRNYPDPVMGDHPDGNAWQPENIAMMNFMKSHHFVLSANFHCGSEVVNFPWDSKPDLHPDYTWYQYISRQYADTAMYYSSPSYLYMKDITDSGFIDGYQWYSVNGGRQDYVNYFLYGREVTIELSRTYIPPDTLLPWLWNYNYPSFLNYMEQCLFGLRGIVTDTITGSPLKAKIEVLNHDSVNSFIFSDSVNGDYHRMLSEGTFNLKFSRSGYYDKVIDNLSVKNQAITNADVQLMPRPHNDLGASSYNTLQVYPDPCCDDGNLTLIIPGTEGICPVQVKVFDPNGQLLIDYRFNQAGEPVHIDLSSFACGLYIYSVCLQEKGQYRGKFTIIK